MTESSLWAAAAERLRASDPYRSALGDGGQIVRVPGPAAAWVTDLLAADLDARLVVVVPHEPAARRWLEGSRLTGGAARLYPVSALSPYQAAEVSLSVRAERSVALDRWVTGESRVLVTTPQALFQRLPPAAELARPVEIRPGDEQPIDRLAQRLVECGYQRVDLVAEVGDFAVRGGVFDVFPPGVEEPLRLDLFGDTVESIRSFDVEDQRSSGAVAEARLLALHPMPVGPAAAGRLAAWLEERLERVSSEARADLEALAGRGSFPGWSALLPALLDDSRSLVTLLANVRLVVARPEAVAEAVAEHWRLHTEDYHAAADAGHLAASPEEIEWPLQRVHEWIDSPWLTLEALSPGSGAIDFGAVETEDFTRQLPRFPRELETAAERGDRVVLVAQPEHRERLERYLAEHSAGDPATVVAAELERGFRLPDAALAVYSERQLFRAPGPVKRRRSVRHGPFVSGLRDLRLGDYVVHTEHGIGRFVGLHEVASGDGSEVPLPATVEDLRRESVQAEVVEIEYADSRRLLLPLTRLDELEKYSGIEGVAPRLDRLGGSSWSRTKARVRAGMRKLAIDLLELYAERQVQRAPRMPPDSDLLAEFEAAFEFEETPDQLEATAAIKEDLERSRPMDRLLCGDVGFGKTEVAMRAAFKVVEGGRQVAVLAPTTILADQHLETFRERFERFPVEIDMISRFRTPAEIRRVTEAVRERRVDILIGTHRILSSDVELPGLGLLIVDEEQRFGVAQKERFTELRKNVHVLSMSATPVPRTLQLALSGVRDLSVIETPPRDRMAVETAIVPFNPQLVTEAIEFELARRGQVYYVYNHVGGIESMQATLAELVPDARITVGHGQMNERELADRMHAFKRREHDVLLATTIIENGIDIPNVNTMLIHRADRFGLAQLYQLRGRVGRSDQLAYCYLLVPEARSLSEVARRRLAAIREFTELGAGFRIAARDLEIRGAGNLLGAEQSGHMAAVGIETYLRMLDETVRELKGEETEPAPSVALDLPQPPAIPTEYVGDANLRMELYRRLAADEASRQEILDELRDRFGEPPAAIHDLLDAVELKRRAEELKVQSISGRGGTLRMRLRQDTTIDVDQLVRLVSERDDLSFSPDGVLSLEGVEPARTLAASRELLDLLGSPGTPW